MSDNLKAAIKFIEDEAHNALVDSMSQTCPNCKKPLEWQEGLLRDGTLDVTVGRYFCPQCNLICRQTESRGIICGKELAKSLVGVSAIDKEITRHSTSIQIGIFRAKMHCMTCDKPYYPKTRAADYCMCEDCECLYCSTKILAKEDPGFVKLAARDVANRLKEAAPYKRQR